MYTCLCISHGSPEGQLRADWERERNAVRAETCIHATTLGDVTETPATTRLRQRRALISVACVAAIAALIGILLLARPTGPAAWTRNLEWPAVGTAALALGDEVAASPHAEEPYAMASITKLVTALVVLDAVPLDPDTQGPTFRMTTDDVDRAEREAARDGRMVAVRDGDQLSLRQLLELTLVASANNYATSLVSHVFGSEGAYIVTAQRWLAEHDLIGIQIADASGMSPNNRATAIDLVTLGRLALDNPVVADIASLPVTFAPNGDMLPNTNEMLGTLGIDGLKSGHTDTAGYTMLFSTQLQEGRLIGVILGSPSDLQRTTDVTRLIATARAATGPPR